MSPDPHASTPEEQPDRPTEGTAANAADDTATDPVAITTRQEFARGLTALREAAGLGVRDVARAVGLPPSTVGDYFGGAHLPPVTTAPRVLAEVLRCLGVDDPDTVAQWQDALLRVRRARRVPPATPPYRGLHSFQPADAAWFFGRAELTALLLSRLADAWAEPGGVMVVGPSGSGKSSLLRAGLVPALRRGDLSVPGPAPVHVPVFTPGAAPLDELARALAGRGRPVPDRRATVLVIDQLEEIFTMCTDGGQRRAFLDELRALTEGTGPVPAGHPVRIVVGLRADFYPHALGDPYLAGLLQRAQVVVGPMTEPQLRQAIAEPAHKAGVELEDGLVDLLLRDLARPVARPAVPPTTPARCPCCRMRCWPPGSWASSGWASPSTGAPAGSGAPSRPPPNRSTRGWARGSGRSPGGCCCDWYTSRTPRPTPAAGWPGTT